MSAPRQAGDGFEEIDLDADEEAAMDRVWAKREKKAAAKPVQLAAEPPSLPPAPVEIPAVVPATFYAKTLGMMERMFRRQRREVKP